MGSSNQDFKSKFCAAKGYSNNTYPKKALSQVLTRRARIIYPFVKIIYPGAFHPERRLVQSAGNAKDLVDIQYEIDFYQHKHVVGSFLRDTMRIRVSGKKLMSLAKSVLNNQS